ncbi:DUF6928 family protein [Dietzia aurantiaca]|uniref:DUF6928 family protein n=1 Tax=Dietzia aurantiaca TaxID=983873 RepID=A0ABV9PM35_9ACTN
MGHHVATFWYLSTDDPAALFRSGVRSDPGFARRLLSRLYPKVTVASLGHFPLNRSASAGAGEIYIGSFPGLTVVQTPISHPVKPSETDPVWLRLVDTPTVLEFSYDPDSGVSGFGRWESGTLVRSFAAADDRIVEDEGMPLPFERPYWAGEFPLEGADDNPLALPFSASALLHAAHRDWLGFDLEPGGLDVPVDGFATDGRREVRQHTPPGPALHLADGPGRAELHAAARRDAGEDDDTTASPYYDDDYERIPFADRARSSGRGLRGLASGLAGELAGRVGDVVRKGAGPLRRGRNDPSAGKRDRRSHPGGQDHGHHPDDRDQA